MAISGAGGLVGSALARRLRARGRRVVRLVRHSAESGPDEAAWDPSSGRIDADRLAGLDAVVHLAGENIASGRWTAARKAEIRTSRVRGTRLLAESLARLARGPGCLVCASAIGYYGDRGDRPLDERSAPGSGFLADTCVEWEAASAVAEEAGIRVVRLRVGVVLSASGGALARMLLPFRLGLGGRVGDGRQFMSWISLEDLLRTIEFALDGDLPSGPVNAVAPQPVRNAEFAATLGRVLRRPAALPLPAPVVRLLFGEMGRELLLASSRVLPRLLGEAGFAFRHPDLTSALTAELGRSETTREGR